jgi:hypothetical protein
MYSPAWCIVVEPSRMTSAPSSSTAACASAVSRSNISSSLPAKSASTSGGMFTARIDAHFSHRW